MSAPSFRAARSSVEGLRTSTLKFLGHAKEAKKADATAKMTSVKAHVKSFAERVEEVSSVREGGRSASFVAIHEEFARVQFRRRPAAAADAGR